MQNSLEIIIKKERLILSKVIIIIFLEEVEVVLKPLGIKIIVQISY